MATATKKRGRKKRRVRARLDRNESPFGTSEAVVRAWEKQRTADPSKYGLNRYGDFFQLDMLDALAAHHGLTPANYTPLSGSGEAGNVLAAALLRPGRELLHSLPVGDTVTRPARAWGARDKWVRLDRRYRQDLGAIAASVGPRTTLVHLQNPHDPTGTSFGQAELERFLDAVAERNPDTYVWIDETYAGFSSRPDYPDTFALIGRDLVDSRVIVSRSLEAAHGLAGSRVAYLAAGQKLTAETEGVTTGFVVPDKYGWANMDAGVNRMGEKALLALLTPDGDAHVERVRKRNVAARKRLVAILRSHRFRVLESDSNFVLARVPGRYKRGGLSIALKRRGIYVRGPRRWGKRFRGFVRISVGSELELKRLDKELPRVLKKKRKPRKAGGSDSAGPPRRLPAASRPGSRRTIIAGAAAAGALALPRALRRLPEGPPPTRLDLTRRQFVARSAAAAGAGGLLLSDRAQAFPPDSFYDTFNLARMIYHENPLGPHPAALEAVREVIARRGTRAAARYLDEDPRDLVEETLAYYRERSSAARSLDHRNVMMLLGSGEGLMLLPDTFVEDGTMISEWPAYRIIRERVWQAKGTVVDVLLDARNQPDYTAMKQALRDHPDTGLIHFNVQNNPVGPVMRKGEFDDFAAYVFRNHPKAVILADESDREYMERGKAAQEPDFPAYVARGDNLVHMSTFSHEFALTGLRVGYLMAPRRLIKRMRPKRVDRPVNVFGHAAALASLKVRDEQFRRSFEVVDEGRRYLYSELDQIGLNFVRSQGQYVFFDTGRSGTAVWSSLIAQGVLTRYGDEWGMESWLRVNPGLPEENRRFIASLKVALGQPDTANPPELPLSLEDLLPGAKTREGRAIARGLQRRIERDTQIQSRMPAFEGSVRVTPASAFERR